MWLWISPCSLDCPHSLHIKWKTNTNLQIIMLSKNIIIIYMIKKVKKYFNINHQLIHAL